MVNKVADKKISDYLNQNKQSLDEINQHFCDVITREMREFVKDKPHLKRRE